MINFKHYPSDAFKLYKEAVEGKRDKTGKECLQLIQDEVKKAYLEYDNAFDAKTTHNLHPTTSLSELDRENLLALYGSNKKIVKTVRAWIDANNKRTYLKVCPYCSLGAANTTEHILPKAIYQEYAVHAKNLIPCCSDCNSRKGNAVRDDKGNPIILNFYYDSLPIVQYLFVEISFDANGIVNFTYHLDNVNNVDTPMFRLIESHFTRLDLLNRFKTKAVSEYAEIENSLLVDLESKGIENCMSDLKKKALKDAVDYGCNHWMVVLKLTLAESEEYKKYLVAKHANIVI